MLKKQIVAAAVYAVIVFPLALVWHLALFKDRYMTFGYFDGEPDIAIGLATIVIQGIALAAIYPVFNPRSAGYVRAFQFAGLLGAFFWTSHVLALVAKQTVPQASVFILLETVYLGLQFGLYALALGFIFRTSDKAEPAAA